MTQEEIAILSGGEVSEVVEANLSRDPLGIAMDSRVPHARLVASQVKYLQRAAKKLPSYYAARCIIPPLAFEQSSGEAASAHKAGYGGGGLCIDLTCGLGVDAYGFSRVFDRVAAVERDPVLAQVARENHARLGAGNIEVVEGDAGEFMERLVCGGVTGDFAERFARSGAAADLVYVDPARRSDAGRKVAGLADCSPDIERLLPLLRAHSRRVMVKLSPMFDVDEAFRIFGTAVVDVVSVGGECKEVLVIVGEGIVESVLRVSMLGSGTVEYRCGEPETVTEVEAGYVAEAVSPDDFRYMVAPDAGLVKARLTERYFRENGGFVGESPYAFYRSEADLPSFVPGTLYRITSVADYDPVKIKKELKKTGVARLNILCRNFPDSPARIASRLGVKEGGGRFAAFVRLGGRLRMVMLDRVR